MGTIRLLLGKTRHRRRSAIPDAWIHQVDSLGHPLHLHITASWRQRKLRARSLERDDCFAPSVRVFGELLRTLWERFGDGRSLLSREAVEIAATDVVAANAERWTWLTASGPPEEVGADIAHLLLTLEGRGQKTIAGTAHDDALNRALQALRKRLGRMDAFVTEPTALLGLRDRLASPTPALRRWLCTVRTVLIEDLLNPSPVQIAVLIELGRAWARVGVDVILTLETGRDLGGREAGYFFEYDDIDGQSLKAFDASRALRKALFDGWIATGEAAIYVAGHQGVSEVEPWSAAQDPEPPDLSDHLHGGPPIAAAHPDAIRALLGPLTLRRAPDPDAEIWAIADAVHLALSTGHAPGDCVVALADLDARAARVRHAFDARSIPYTLSSGSPLIRVPSAKALLGIATLALRAYPARDLLQLLDQLAVPLAIAPMTLLEWCRAAGVHGGHPDAWRTPLRRWAQRARKVDQLTAISESLDALGAQCAQLDGFLESRTADVWRSHLLDTAERLGLLRAVEADETLRSWTALLKTLDQLVLDLTAVSRDPWSAEDLATHLGRAIARSRWYPDPPSDERVALVGLLELKGSTPKHLWLGGLTRGAFPRPRPPSGLLPGAVQRRLETVDPLKEARYLFASVMRNALGDPGMLSATLSWPSTQDGRHVAPSPVLADLLALPTGDGACLGDGVVDAFEGRDRRPASEPAWDLAQQIQHRARLAHTPNPYVGFLERPPPLPRSIPVTAFEQYLRCPARYAYDRLLGLRTEEAWTEELEPRRRGTALHRILEAFLLRRGLASLYRDVDREAAAAQLHEVASEILDTVEAEGGFEPLMQAYARDRWLAGLVDSAPAGLLRAWLDSEIDAPLPSRPIAVERAFSELAVGPTRLRGSIDRIDQVGDTLRITDYKTGSPPARRLVQSGLAFQPIAYAAALAQSHPGVPLTARFLSLKRPDTLRHTPEIDLSDTARQPLLERAEIAAHDMAAGHFPTTRHGPVDAGCAWCPHRRICRADHTRSQMDPTCA